ncbi:MAG: hypothetical protein HY520_02220, partial [Candidatus Aenigmarchaeota archaeon]|nr:hypothetical protein [Candidatus Aenigmarchaeota archaeon]
IVIAANATSPANLTLAYSVNDSRFQQNGSRFAWQTGFQDSGNHSFLVSVTDGFFSDSQVVLLEIFNVNLPPAITSIPPLRAFAGTLYTYDVEAIDPDNNPITYSLPQAPAGMIINTTSGLIQWLPSACLDPPAAGKNLVGCQKNVSVQVSDGLLADTQNFTIAVVKAWKR